MQYTMNLKLKENGKAFFGPGPVGLLQLIKEGNSLNQAAAQLGMAYSKAWKILQEAEQGFGYTLLERQRGGISGGGSVLTEKAIGLLEHYNQFQSEMYQMGNQLFEKYFGVADHSKLEEKKAIYFDNAATSLPKPPSVGRAVQSAIENFGGPGRGGHTAGLQASRCIFHARKAVADLLGSKPERVVFTSNATESLNIAIEGLLGAKDHVITTALEHNSVLRPLYRLCETGMELSIVAADSQGNIAYDEFQACLRPNTKAVVCTHASNLTGMMLDLHQISRFCKKNGLLFIVDVSQTAGVFSIDADKMGIDVLCFTGHKGLMGPQGTGGLCIGMNISMKALKVGGSGIHSYSKIHPTNLPEALEAGTQNAHGIAGLLAGILYIKEVGIENIQKTEQERCNQFLEGVNGISGIHIYGNHNITHAPIVALNIGTMDSAQVGDILSNLYGICVRAGAHCAPLIHEALGTKEQGAVRFSFSSFNTEEEVQIAIEALTAIAKEQEEEI